MPQSPSLNIMRLQELADEVEGFRAGESLEVELKTKSYPQPTIVYGLAVHGAKASAAGVRLWASGSRLIAMPLLRLAWECGITAQWACESETGAEALLNNHVRSKKAFRTNMQAVFSFQDGAIVGGDADLDPLFSGVDEQGKKFEKRCLALETGPSLYLIYRAMSAACHAGVDLADEYIEGRSEGWLAPITLRDAAKRDDEDNGDIMAPHFAVIASVWGARALDAFQPSRPNRSRLREISLELGSGEPLSLTAQAQSDEARKIQEKRRGQWKPPRQAR